jgi:hypothetical protein
MGAVLCWKAREKVIVMKNNKSKKGIIPNRAGSKAGKWYPFEGRFKIEPVENSRYEDGTPTFRITIGTLPELARRGIIIQELFIDSESGRDYFYDWNKRYVYDDMIKLMEYGLKSKSYEIQQTARKVKSFFKSR